LDYPEFAPPGFSKWGQKASDWTHEEALDYFHWLMAAKSSRVENFLTFLGLTPGPTGSVASVGERAAAVLSTPTFSTTESQHRLTNAGDWLAADLGLFWAEELLRDHPRTLRWDLVTKPRNHVDFHLPVISGFPRGMLLNPIHNAINTAVRFLQGELGLIAFAQGFSFWENLIKVT